MSEPREPKRLKAGDRVRGAGAVFEVEDPRGYAGVLPIARIVEGPNVGVRVILTSPYRRAGS